MSQTTSVTCILIFEITSTHHSARRPAYVIMDQVLLLAGGMWVHNWDSDAVGFTDREFFPLSWFALFNGGFSDIPRVSRVNYVSGRVDYSLNGLRRLSVDFEIYRIFVPLDELICGFGRWWAPCLLIRKLLTRFDFGRFYIVGGSLPSVIPSRCWVNYVIFDFDIFRVWFFSRVINFDVAYTIFICI